VQHSVLYQPSYTLLQLILDEGESVQAEAGAMVSRTPNVEMQTQARGGILGGLKRLVGGESFFINTFTCASREGELTLAPPLPGDLLHIPMTGGSVFVQSGSYIANTPGITIDSKWGGARSFFSGEGLIILKADGAGDLFVSSYGAIHAVELAQGQTYIVDTGHMVAFDATMTYNVRGAGGMKETLLSGEGLVCEFVGPGRLYLQTRSMDAFLKFLVPKLPKSGS